MAALPIPPPLLLRNMFKLENEVFDEMGGSLLALTSFLVATGAKVLFRDKLEDNELFITNKEFG